MYSTQDGNGTVFAVGVSPCALIRLYRLFLYSHIFSPAAMASAFVKCGFDIEEPPQIKQQVPASGRSAENSNRPNCLRPMGMNPSCPRATRLYPVILETSKE